jgi:dynein heavy chain
MFKLAIASILFTVFFYQVRLAYNQSTINTVAIPSESVHCLTPEQRRNTIRQLRENIYSILNEQQLEIIESIVPECGDGLWYRVAYLNMTDPSQQCPPAWREYNTSGVRACGRPVSDDITGACPSTFHSNNRQYSRVCGRVIGFQVGSPDGFNPTCTRRTMVMDGIVISHGESQHHIWSYIAGASENSSDFQISNCPCSPRAGTRSIPSVGNNYYCESGNPTERLPYKIYPNDPLWDGQQCEGTCCSGTKSPPWFSVQLPTNTTDRIEVRICADELIGNEDTPIQLLEIFVQ